MSDDGAAVPDAGTLFHLLGDDRRMRILRALWDGFEFEAYVTESREGTPFGRLRERAGIDDPGNFNYHLGELVDVLVANREDGYVLTPLGYNLMGAVERYETFEYTSREEWVTDDPCPFCTGDLVAAYRRGVLSVRCRDCRGIAEDGNVTFVQLSASGTRHLDDGELLDAAALAMFSKVRSSVHGSCWECRAPMNRTLVICEDHDRDAAGVCDACSLRYRATVETECEACNTSGTGPVLEYAVVAPAVAAAFAEVGRGPRDVGPWRYRLGVLAAATERVVETDPVTVEVAVPVDGAISRVRIEDRPSGPVIDPA